MSILAPNALAARVTSTPYHSGNRLPGQTTADYDIRDTANHYFNIGMASDGVVDMGISLDNTLGVNVGVSLYALHDRTGVGGAANSPGGVVFYTTAGSDDMPQGGRWWMLPEASTSVAGTSRHIEVPELRAPISGLRLVVTARTAPTAGTFSIVVVRRY